MGTENNLERTGLFSLGPFIEPRSADQRHFNHDIMRCTAEGVEGNHLYSARALGMTRRGDIIQLAPELKSEWSSISRHYTRIGLEHTQEVIWNVSLEQFRLTRDFQPSVFFFGEQENSILQDENWLSVVNYINSKNNFVRLAEELGVPAPFTFCFERAELIDHKAIAKLVYPCYLKAAISVSGVGIYRCESPQELMLAAKNFPACTPVQVQDEVRASSFLNMQYEVVDGVAQRLLATEQILDGTVHQGNRCPARAEPWDLIHPLAAWMAERGFKDILAFDVALVETGQDIGFQVIECNPRFNGASYPTAIARKLDIPEWSARIYSTWRRSLADIDLTGLEYHEDSGTGVIIVNWGTILVGKLMIMLAGPLEFRKQLDMELQKRLW